MRDGESKEPTPYQVVCRARCGPVYMTDECYIKQMEAADSLWRCPRCGYLADWNDANYEAWQELREDGP